MHTFLAIAGSRDSAGTLASFGERLRSAVPFAGDERTEITELPELEGGFVTIASRSVQRRFETWWEGALAVLFHGELFGVKEGLRAAVAAENDALYAELVRGPLLPIVRESALAPASVARELFAADGIERLLDEHARGARDHTEALGMLLTLERWRALRERVRSLPG